MEEAVRFICNDKRLYGVLHIPDKMPNHSTVVILVTGGPQVRTGSHRLYVQLSRFLCEHNWPSLRFDYEGMGDSEGEFVGFQYAEQSITAAMEFLRSRFNDNIKFLFWSLCDGATAVAIYAANHPQYICGLVLCNPLVLTEEGLARSTIKHYYRNRLLRKDFWLKLISFQLDWKDTFKSILNYLKAARFLSARSEDLPIENEILPKRVINSLSKFNNPIRILLSSDDIVALNFQDAINKNKVLNDKYREQKIVNLVIRKSSHTFTDPRAKKELFSKTLNSIEAIVSTKSHKRFQSK